MGIKYTQLPVLPSAASDDQIAVLDTSENVLSRTSISHASNTSAFGLGTSALYGHVKLQDDLGATTYADGVALSARQGNMLAKDIGPVETGNTATAAYAANEYFIWKGQFVKAKTSIAVGAAITSSNTTVTSVTTAIQEIAGSVLPADPTTNGDWVLHSVVTNGTVQRKWVAAGPEISFVN